MVAEQILSAGTEIRAQPQRSVRAKPDREADALGEVGWYLQRARVGRGETLLEIGETLNLQPVHLAALEQGDFEYLPQGAHVFDVLTRYADYLGYEAAPLVTHYENILRARSLSVQGPDKTDETIVWFGDYMQQARNFARIAAGPGVLGLILAVSVGLISFYTFGPMNSELQRQAATSEKATPEKAKPEGRAIITSSVPKQVPEAEKLVSSTPPPLQDRKIEPEQPARVPQKTVALPQAKSVPPQIILPKLPRAGMPDVRIRVKPLSGSDKETMALPKMARDRLTQLIDRDIRAAVQSAHKRIASVAVTNQTSGGTPQKTATVTQPGKITPSGLATNSVYGSKARDVRVVLRAKEQVWVRVEDNKGNIIFTQTLGVGDSYRVPAQKGLMLDARNAGALDYSVDGSMRGTLGTQGEIVIGLPLDVTKLAARKN